METAFGGVTGIIVFLLFLYFLGRDKRNAPRGPDSEPIDRSNARTSEYYSTEIDEFDR